jgi:hypothetical protein
MFQRAQRSQAKLRLGLTGASGSGKTYSALLIAKGLGGKVAFIDTENRSGDLYSDLIDFDILHLVNPFTVEKYVDAIELAETSGYDILIIDSISHAWAGEGGVLDYVDRLSSSNFKGNSFTAWRQGGRHQDQLINKILRSQMHTIITMRSKTEYVVEMNDRGKQSPRKLGMAPVQRDNVEYEFTTVLDLSMDNVASSSKDRTKLFKIPKVLSEEDGVRLNGWLNDGKGAADIEAEKMRELEACKMEIELIASEQELNLIATKWFNRLSSKFGVQKGDADATKIREWFLAQKEVITKNIPPPPYEVQPDDNENPY